MVSLHSHDSMTAALGTTAASLAVYYLYKYLTRKSWKVVGKVSDILIYPIKSGPPISLKEATCTESGLVYRGLKDR